MRRVRLALVLLAAFAFGGPGPAQAQVETREGIYLQNQIQELKRDIQGLRDQLSRGAGGSALGGTRPSSAAPVTSGDLTAALLDRVARLEDEVRQLRGRTDEAANAQKRMGEDLGKQIDDLSFKIDNTAPKTATPARPTTALPPLIAPTVTTPTPAPLAPGKRTAEVAMQEGNAALARRDYGAAEAAAREVLAIPKTPRATDAQFLLAQAVIGKKDYQAAAVAYDDTYNRARTGTHAQDSLLGLANSLNAIGEKRAACATLDKLRAEFPTPRVDLKEPIGGARQRAGCR